IHACIPLQRVNRSLGVISNTEHAPVDRGDGTMFIENPLTEEEWADESEWLVERDRLTGRALRAWSHIQHRLLMLLENFLPHPRFDFAGQLWSGGADSRTKLDMIARLGDGHLPERQLDEFHRLLAEAREHHARIGAIAQHRACEAYFVEDA